MNTFPPTTDVESPPRTDLSAPGGADLQRFFLTFGTQYAYTEHPTMPDVVHPHGWVTLIARDEETARAMAVTLFGSAWAFLYTEETFNPGYHVAGELACFRAVRL